MYQTAPVLELANIRDRDILNSVKELAKGDQVAVFVESEEKAECQGSESAQPGVVRSGSMAHMYLEHQPRVC